MGSLPPLPMPNGAYALIRTLVDAGVSTCFTNPGTTELFLVEAMDSVPEMRTVLTLFEGVATGAADGYARMAGAPASTLLHLGPGLGNGLANLHNARRAKVPLVNIVGDHAQDHLRHDPPLRSDIETVARSVSTWVRTSKATSELALDTAEAVRVATGPPAQVATLIVPANLTWEDGAVPSPPQRPSAPCTVPTDVIESVAKRVRAGGPTALLLGGNALQVRSIVVAGRIAAALGARIFAERTAPRIERGAGLPSVERLAYWPELVSAQLEGLQHLMLIDTGAPVSFFAYAGRESSLVPAGCEVHQLSTPTCDVVMILEALAEALNASDSASLQERSAPRRPTGQLTAETVAQAIGATLPEGAIVADEALTSGGALAANTAGRPRHTWLPVAGGALGQGMPAASGAAIACPDRPVIALEGDGAALYSMQSLWTMAREQLNVTVIIFNNRAYRMISTEFTRHGKQIGDKARSVSDLGNPDIDFVALAAGLGVPSGRVDDAGELTNSLERAIAEPGPHLIETIIPAV